MTQKTFIEHFVMLPYNTDGADVPVYISYMGEDEKGRRVEKKVDIQSIVSGGTIGSPEIHIRVDGTLQLPEFSSVLNRYADDEQTDDWRSGTSGLPEDKCEDKNP
jgi:hypothetical protein